MTASPSDLEQLLSEARRLTGVARWAALDAVFRHADAAGEVAFGYRARLGSIEEFHDNGEYARMLMAFSSCLATFDQHPEVTTEWDANRLLWAYKWVLWEATQFAGIARERIDGLLDDMQERYERGGHSPHAVYQHRGLVARHRGELDAATRWYELMTAARRDSLSDCSACVPSGHAATLAAAGEFERAIEVGQPYSNGGCSEQPHWMLSELLVPYLRTGRLAEAAAGHRRAYRKIRDSRHHLELVGLNVEFCALTGNEAHALPIIEHHLPWLDRPASTYAAMELASAAALVLSRLAPDQPVRRRTDDGTARWDSTAAQTGAELAELARGLAAEFDARNGNDYQGRRIAARLAAAPLVAELPLSVLRGRPIAESSLAATVRAGLDRVAELSAAGDRVGAARAQLEVAFALRTAGQLDDAAEAAEEARRSLDAAGADADALLARYLLVQLYDRQHDHVRVRVLVDELLAAPTLPPGVAGRAELLVLGLPADPGAAVARLLEAAALHRAAGDQAAETRCLRRALSFQRDPRVAGLRAVVARLDELVGPGTLGYDQLQVELCRAEMAAGDYPAALTRARRPAAPSGGPGPGEPRLGEPRLGEPRLGEPGLGEPRLGEPRLRECEAEILWRLGRLAEAEVVARKLLPGSWVGVRVLVLVLRAMGRDDELAAFAAEHHLDDALVQEILDEN